MKNKLLTIITVIALMVSMTSIALANGDQNGDHKVTICHHTGSITNPGVTITIDKHALEKHVENHDDGDVDEDGACKVPPPPVPELSPMILTSAGLLGLIGIVQVSRKLRK